MTRDLPTAPPGFRILREIGEGAFKITYEAVHELSQRHVALKRYKNLNPCVVDPKDLTISFFDAQALHTNLVPTIWLHDGWLLEPLLDYSFAECLTEDKLLPWKRFYDVASGLLAGMEAMHSRGLIHGDIKPHNMGCAGDKAVLCDFGTATVPGNTDKRRDYPGTIRTRPPEEHSSGTTLSFSGDVWRMAASLLALRTGWYPFVSEEELRLATDETKRSELATRVSNRVATGQLALHARVRQALEPEWFASLICRCLQFNPKARPTAREFQEAFSRRDAHFGVASKRRDPLDRQIRFEESSGVEPLKLSRHLVWSDCSTRIVKQAGYDSVLVGGKGWIRVVGPDFGYRTLPVPNDGEVSALARVSRSSVAVGTKAGMYWLLDLEGGRAQSHRFSEEIRDLCVDRHGRVFLLLPSRVCQLQGGRSDVIAEFSIPAWRMVLSAGQSDLIVSTAEPGRGEFRWLKLHNGFWESCTQELRHLITAAGLSRHPRRNILSIGNALGGLTLFHFQRTPTGQESRIKGTSLAATGAIVDEDIPGEAYTPYEDWCSAAGFSDDGRWVAAGHRSGAVAVWSMSSGSETAYMPPGQCSVDSLVISANCYVMLATQKGLYSGRLGNMRESVS